VPDLSHSNEPMHPGVMAWNNLIEAVDVPAESMKAQFLFSFTNISDKAFAITTVHPSCGCTTAKIPALPWVVQPGGTGEIPITVNIAGKNGMVFKTVFIATERGSQTLTLRINIAPPVVRKLTDAERMQGVDTAKVDRQAVFKGDCASCHAKNVQGKYSKDLYDSVCGICHDSPNRASMVPDLRALKVPTNNDFWRTWISLGKPGSLMPAFAASQGGPLNDVQIASLAAYLNSAIPSHVPPGPQ
jgi:mono/diheme cytochrome c family protein